MLTIDTSFLLVEAEWPVADTRVLLERLEVHYVIVRSGDPERGARYHVYLRDPAVRMLTDATAATTGEILARDPQRATSVVTRGAFTEAQTKLAVVMEARTGVIAGVFHNVRNHPREIAPARPGSDHALVAELPRRLAVGETASLRLWLSPHANRMGAVPIALAPGSELDLVIRVRDPLTPLDPTEIAVCVPDRGAKSPTVCIRLEALREGWAHVDVHAFRAGQAVASLTLSTEIVRDKTRCAAQPQRIDIVATAQPDLSMIILEDAARNSYTIRLTAADPELRLNFRRFGPIELRDPAAYVAKELDDLQRLGDAAGGDRAAFEHRLAAKGDALFEALLPAELQAELWSLRERITSVQIQSEEPWIPWEICRLNGSEGGRRVAGEFFCEAFAVTRWLVGVPQQHRLSLDHVAMVVPRDSGLAGAQGERRDLEQLLPRVAPVPASLIALREAMTAGTYNGWHFAGHGLYDDTGGSRARLHLEGGHPFLPEHICGVVANLGLTRPIVFWNACHAGRAGLSLTGIGGWARQFLAANAGAFIGACWAVDDEAAHALAVVFYRELLSGVPLGEAMRRARREIRNRDASWLAYTVYGHPLATVARGA